MIDALIFSAWWLAFVLCMQVTGWGGNGISIVNDLDERNYGRKDEWIIRFWDRFDLTSSQREICYWTFRSSYGYPVIILMALWYREPWILAIGLLTQLIGPWGYMLSRISQWNNNWRMVEMGMGVVFAIMVSLTKGVI